MSDAIRLDHVGVAVRSIAAARGFYELMGFEVGAAEEIAHEAVRVAMVPMDGSRVELIEATAEDSVIGRFVARRGEGVHHLAVRVDGVDAEFERLRAAGVRMASENVKVGAGGHRYFLFIRRARVGF